MFRRKAALLGPAHCAWRSAGAAFRSALRRHHVPTNRAASAEPPSAAPRASPILPPVNVEPLVLAPGQTVVTITFDDGRASNAQAAQMLNAMALRGTFFINSGNIGKPGYLTLTDLDWIATDSGNEIGGHTVNHRRSAHDSTPTRSAARSATTAPPLMGWGFPVRNFAYPFA